MANILTHNVQTSFLSGVLDPRVQGRVDTSAYTSSLLVGTNIELSDMGGVTRRRGTIYAQTMPYLLTQQTGTYAVPEGATYAVAKYGNGVYSATGAPSTPAVALGSDFWGIYLTTTTVATGVTNPYVIAQITLPNPTAIQYADVTCLSLTGGETVNAVIQYSTDNTNWTTLLAIPQVDNGNGTSGYAYRAVGPVTAQYWRVAIIGGANLGTALVSIGDFTLWSMGSVISNGRLIPFEVSTGEQYALVLTDRTCTVVAAAGGKTLQVIPVPYTSASLPAVDAQSSAETLCLTHESYQPMFVIRQNSPLVVPTTSPNFAAYYNFQPFPVIFDAIPQVYYADDLSPTPTSDVQTLTFGTGGWNAGDTFTVTMLTDTTGPIVYSGDDYAAGGAGFVGATSKAIAAAVQALWAVNGFTGVSCAAGASALHYTLTFAGAAAAPIGIISITSVSSNSTATAVENTVGVAAQENLWSPVRGYPGTISFFQGRLYFGGFQSQSESVVGSWVNNILNFSTAQGLDDQAVYVTLAGVNLNAINGLFPGKSLCLFTTGGEYRFVNDQNEAVTPSSAPQNQTQYGGAHIKPVMIDGNIIFVQRNLNQLRDFQFDYTVDQFNSLGISALCPNLVYSVQDIAAWQGAVEDALNYVFVCNGTNPNTDFDSLPNGSCSVYNTRKEVGVQAWTNWQTLGLYMNVCTVVTNILFLVQRTINGVTSLFLEQPTPNTYTDCNYFNASLVGATQVTGLNWLNGQTVRCLADGYVLDSQVVTGGIVPLISNGETYTTTSQVEIGLNFNPIVTPMPLQTVRWPSGTNLAHKKRISAIRGKVRETGGMIIDPTSAPSATAIQTLATIGGSQPQMNQLDNFKMDNGPLPLYTGIFELEESTNWDQDTDKMITLTQVDPLPMQILFLDVTLSSEQG